MSMTATQQQLAQELTAAADIAPSVEDLMTIVVGRLQERLDHYNWVGFYMIERSNDSSEPVLVLGPYVGAATPHTRIPLDQGVCGAAAASGHTVIVDDVNTDARYLACSLETKSEIVAPIRVKGEVVGELDIDSHTPAAFQAEDRQLVEHCARLVGLYLEKAACSHSQQ
jgi:GAF domain-containing protein